MKTLSKISLFFWIVFFANQLAAQVPIVIEEQEMNMSRGMNPAYIIEIPQAEIKNVLKAWSKYIRQNTKSKVETEGEEQYIIGTQINEISNIPINIYSVSFKLDSSVKLISFFEIDSIFFKLPEDNSDITNEKTFYGIRNFLLDFAADEYRKAVINELKQEEANLKSLTKELISLEKDNISFRKEIKEYELDIQKSEEAIASLENEKSRKAIEVENKKLSVNSLSNDDVLMADAKKQLRILEKEKKSIEKSIEKEHKNIVSSESGIIENNRNIDKNLLNQESKLSEISEQESKIERITSKLENIE